jgi:protein arginine kinase
MSARPAALSAEPLPAWIDGTGPEADTVISTRIRLARNLANHRFPPHASTAERSAIFRKVAGVLAARPFENAFTVINFSAVGRLEQQLLVEKRAASPDLLSLDGDRGVAHDASHRVAIMINEEDHLRLQGIDAGCRPLDLWETLDPIDRHLGRQLEFAFEERRGFLTCCPTNSGTGLRVSFLMHLPGLVLTKSVDAVLQAASQMGIAARGFFGEHSAVVGSFFQLSNRATLGADEREFIDATLRTIAEVMACERRARERLMTEARLEVTDRIYRAYGILKYARTLSVTEFLNCASALRLGVDCGLFSKVTREGLNRTLLAVLPAHLRRHAGTDLDDAAASRLRVELVRSILMRRNRPAAA